MESRLYKTLAQFGHELLADHTLNSGLLRIAEYAKKVIGAQRCSVYIYDAKRQRLWTTLADGINRIEMPSGEGLAGLAVEEERSFIENRPYDNPRFNDSIDRQSGFHTKNIIVSPIFDSHGKVMGVIQLLNKSGGFDEKDLEFLPFFAHFVSGFIELAILRDRGL